jgi:uncharacterized membrane protein YfhO
MKNKTNPFKWLFKENPFYFAAFFLPAIILFVSYILFGVYPFGERSVLALDLNGQYVYYFDYMYDVFRGNAGVFYSWSRSLSGEFFGILSYYLASPFNFIVWLFPREYITEGILTMLLAKVGAIGLCMAVYLKRGRNYNAGTAVIFSMMYALSSYVIVQTMNPMWLDGVLALPLVIYGAESLVKRGRFRLLIVSLFYSFVTCFYIGYMVGIFTVLYFICYLISSRDSESARIDGGAVMARIGLFAISAATAVLMASFVLIPVYSSLTLGKTDFTAPFEQEGFTEQTNFILADLAQKLFPNTYDTVRNEGLPFIYSGTLVLILLPLFFFGGRENVISVRRRAAGAVLALALIISMYYTPVDTFMHGMQIPNWLPFRYSFMLSFLFVAWGAEVFDKLRQFSRRTVGLSALGIFGLLMFYESRGVFGTAILIPALTILVVLTIILLCNKNKKFGKTALTLTIGAVVFVELLQNTYLSIEKQDEDITYSDRGTYTDFVIPLRVVIADTRDADDGFYRIEKTFFRTVNDPLALGMYGMSHSASTFNEAAVTLLGKLGMTSRGHYTRYSGATQLVDDLFGVRYVFSHSNYGYGQPLDAGVLSMRHNESALPIIYLTDTRLADFNFNTFPNDDVNIFRRQNRLLSSMLGDTAANEYFRVIDAANIYKATENITEGGTSDGHFSYHAINDTAVASGSARITYSMTAEADGRIYMWLPTAHERRAGVSVARRDGEGAVIPGSSEHRGWTFEYDDYCIVNLGEFSRGERFTVTLTLLRDDLYYKNALFAYLDTELYGAAIASLHALNAQTAITKRSDSNIRIDVFSDTERLLFTTIPAEPGWTVLIDGREVQPVTVLGALTGVRLPAGKHVVELIYTPAGYPVALFLSGGGVLLFILLCVFYMKMKKEDDGQLTMDNGQLTMDNETIDNETIDADGQLTIEDYDSFEFDSALTEPEEAAPPVFTPFAYGLAAEDLKEIEPEPEPEEQQADIVLGSDESFESVIADFAVINAEPDEPEPDESLPAEEEPELGDTSVPDIEIDDGFLLVPEVELVSLPEDETDIALDDLVAPEIEFEAEQQEPDVELDDLSLPEISLEPEPEPEQPLFEPEQPLFEPEKSFFEPETEAEPELEFEPEAPPPPTLKDIDFEARKRALLGLSDDFEEEAEEPEATEPEPPFFEPEPEPEEPEVTEPEPPPAQIDFAARKRALELELMQQRESFEQSFSGDIAEKYEEEFEVTEIIPTENAQPVVTEAEAQPVFTFEEDIEDFLFAGSSNNIPGSGLFDGDDDTEKAEAPPESETVGGDSPPTLHTPAPWKDYNDVFEEFEFIMADETEFVGTFEEVGEPLAEAEAPAEPEPEEEPPFIPPFGPGTL